MPRERGKAPKLQSGDRHHIIIILTLLLDQADAAAERQGDGEALQLSRPRLCLHPAEPVNSAWQWRVGVSHPSHRPGKWTSGTVTHMGRLNGAPLGGRSPRYEPVLVSNAPARPFLFCRRRRPSHEEPVQLVTDLPYNCWRSAVPPDAVTSQSRGPPCVADRSGLVAWVAVEHRAHPRVVGTAGPPVGRSELPSRSGRSSAARIHGHQ